MMARKASARLMQQAQELLTISKSTKFTVLHECIEAL
jgi:hypothetical protein